MHVHHYGVRNCSLSLAKELSTNRCTPHVTPQKTRDAHVSVSALSGKVSVQSAKSTATMYTATRPLRGKYACLVYPRSPLDYWKRGVRVEPLVLLVSFACSRWYRRWTQLLDPSRALLGKYACSVYPRLPLDYWKRGVCVEPLVLLVSCS